MDNWAWGTYDQVSIKKNNKGQVMTDFLVETYGTPKSEEIWQEPNDESQLETS